MNRSAWKLAGVALSTMWLFGFTAGSCFGEPIEPIDEPSNACDALDEASCGATDACVAIYEYAAGDARDCYCAPCRPEGDCPTCDCGTGPVAIFVGCEPRPTEPVCPAIGCELYCEYGNLIGDDGCALCACNPGPGGCGAITDEWACIDAGCVPEYGGGTDLCAPCAPDADCFDCMPEPSGFTRCTDPYYQGECWSDIDCPQGMFCAYTGGAGEAPPDCACACDAAGNCDPCDCGSGSGGAGMPAPTGMCIPYEPACRMDSDCGGNGHCWDGLCYYDQGCVSDFDCAAGERCEYGANDPMPCDCFCDPSTPDCQCGCAQPAPMGVCVPGGEPQCFSDADCGGRGYCLDGLCQYQPECYGDADCWGGYCEFGGATDCAGADCGGGMIAPGGYCVYPSCDDGSPAICDMIPPECPAGQVTAVRDGCFECVDARSCQPADVCFGAWTDEAGMCRGPADGALPPECCGVVCAQVVTYAADPSSGTCYAFATPCDVPADWAPCGR